MYYEPDNRSQDINPANGLPMIDDTDIDVCGNTYGTDGGNWQPICDSGPGYAPFLPSFDPW